MQKIINWFVEKWDWWIYWRAYSSLKRMSARNGGFAYLIRLQLDDWLNEHPLDESLKRSTELFYQSLSSMAQTPPNKACTRRGAGGASESQNSVAPRG